MHQTNQARGHLHSATVGLLLTFLLCVPVRGADGATSAGERLRLRNETAIHYMKPESHLRLARYHYNLGNRVQAFYIAEYARQMFGDDDPTVQTHALHTLLDHSGDIADLNVIRSMLKSDDLVKRAMAAFLVVKCLGPAEFPLLGENLTSGIELVQIDTMEALGMTGGPKGLEYLKAHPPAKATGEIMGFWRHQISPRHNPGEKDGPENGGQSPGSPE